MRVNEIVREERLDELIPLAAVLPAGMTIGRIISIVGAFLTGLTAIDILTAAKKYNEDPEQLTDDDWDNVFLDIAVIALGPFAKVAAAGLVKVLPRSVIRKGSGYVRKKALDQYKLDKSKIDKKYGAAAQSGKTPQAAGKMKQKRAELTQQAKERARNRISGFPSKIATAVSTGVAANFAYDYWEKISALELEFEQRMAGDLTTNSFGDMSEQEARAAFIEEKNRLVGQLTMGIGAAIAGATAGKAVAWISGLFGKGATALTGSTLAGSIIEIPGILAAKLLKYGGPGLTLFMQTETGQKFLANVWVDTIVGRIGALTNTSLNLLYNTIDELAAMAGVENATADLRSKADKLAADPKLTPNMLDNTPDALRVQTEPGNPKIKYVGGVQITDKDGFQAVGNNYLRMIQDDFRAAKMTDPTIGIPKKPGVDYNY